MEVKLRLLVESRIRGNVYVRFGGECLETCFSNRVRRRVLSLHHPILFPVVTIIVMELFISKMRKLKGLRKMLAIDEAWIAIAKSGMAEFIKYLYKTVRKFNGIAALITQEVDDLISSPIIRETVINLSDTKLLLDMRKFAGKFDRLQQVMGMPDKAKTLLLSLNRANEPGRNYREVMIDQGGQSIKVYRNELCIEEYLVRP